VSLRVVIDNSTLVSAALRPDSIPQQALQSAILFNDLYTSVESLRELERVLSRKKFDRYISRDLRIEFLRKLRRDSLLCMLTPALLQQTEGVCRDPTDDKFLALCLAANADVLVSSDQDLLVLNPWRGIPILTPAQFLAESEV
jgi:uncharacterized protein